MICAIELESGGILVMKGVVLPIMGDPVPVPAPAPRAIEAVQHQGHSLLLQDDEMTTLLPHGERRHIAQSLPGVSQKNMKKTRSGDPILPPVEMATNMMLIMLLRRGRHHLAVTDPLHTGGCPGNPRNRLRGPAPGPPTGLPPAVTDRRVLRYTLISSLHLPSADV